MDGDTMEDSVSGIVASDLAMHGISKIDDLQTAIINKDVMLSGISSQSPVASASQVSSKVTSGLPITALGDNVFLGLQSLGMTNLMTELARPAENSSATTAGLLSQVYANVACNSPTPFGQSRLPAVAAAPQLFLAAAGSQTTNAANVLPVQHVIIPVTANGVQQLLTVPLSLQASSAASAAAVGPTVSSIGQMQQLLATPAAAAAAAAQLITTNVNASPLNVAGLSTAGSNMPLLMIVPPSVNSINPVVLQSNAASAAAVHTLALQQLSQQQSATASAASSLNLAQLPQLLTNAQGQIVAVGSPQIQALLSGNSSNAAAAAAVGAKLVACLPASSNILNQQQVTAAAVNFLLSNGQLVCKSENATTNSGNTNTSLSNNLIRPPQNSSNNGGGGGIASLSSNGSTSSSPSAAVISSNGTVSSITHITPNINQLLPNTISSTREGTIVDGVNLDEMREFAKQFKIRRLSLGLTQTQVGQALSVTEGPSYSQSAICRFEKLDITPKSAQKIKPVLERWMAMAEERYKNGAQNLSEFIGLEPSKKRKRRTSFTPQALELLNDYFDTNTHPSGAEMTNLADKLNFDREVIRVWFCNKRQTLKNSIKKIKGPSPPVT